MNAYQSINNKNIVFFDILILTMLLIVGFSFYGFPPLLPPDEGRYASIGAEMLRTHQFIVPHIDGVIYFEKPPLVYWLIAIAIKLFGTSTWAVRAFNPILSWFGVIITYICCIRIYDRKVAFIAACIIGANALYLAIGRILTLDAAVGFFINASILCFLTGLQPNAGKQRPYWFYAAYVLSGLAVMTKGLIGVIFPIMAIGLWVCFLKQWKQVRSFRIVSGLIIVAIIAVPWIVLTQLQHHSFFYQYVIRQQFLRFLTKADDRYVSLLQYCAMVIISLLPFVFLLPQSIKRIFVHKYTNLVERQNDLFFFIWGVSIVVFFALSSSMLFTYLVTIVVPFSVLMARYFVASQLITGVTNRSSRVSLWVLVGFFFCCALALPILYVLIQYRHHHFEHLPMAWLLLVIGVCVTILAFVAVYAVVKNRFKWVFVIAMLVSITLINVIWVTVPILSQRSILPLEQKAKLIVRQHPDMRVVSYYHYYQSLPFYLNRRIIIVNWRDELTFGYNHQKSAKQWMISGKQFWQKWFAKVPMLVFMEKSDYDSDFYKKNRIKYYLIGMTPRNVLLSNINVNAQ